MPLRSVALFGSPPAESILRRHNLDSLDAIFQAAAHARVRHAGRSVFKTQLQDDDGKAVSVYFKLSWGRRRWWPRWRDLRSGQVLASLAQREWDGLQLMEQAGIRVPERLAWFEEGLLWKRSAIALRAVPPPASISDLLLDGIWRDMPLNDRQEILGLVLDALNAIEGAGLGWRGASTRHVFPVRASDGRWKIWLIDCEGVYQTRSPAARPRAWHKFLRSLHLDHADEATLSLLPQVAQRSLSVGQF